MITITLAIAAWLAAALAGGADAGLASELERLEGQRVAVRASGYVIQDIAGEGPPTVGTVCRRGDDLWLEPEVGAPVELSGPLATPRIAGPNYKIWVIGDLQPDGRLWVRRLGVLRPPVKSAR